jgi:hypothetical protein
VGALDGLIAGLVHLGLPQDSASQFGEHVHKGDALVIAHASTPELATQARAVLEAHHPRAEVAPGGVVSVSPTTA